MARAYLLAFLVAATAAETWAAIGTASLAIHVVNETGAAIAIDVEGALASDAVLPPDAAAGAGGYAVHLVCPPGSGACGSVAGLRPGAWVHRLSVTVPGSDAQRQSRRYVLVAGAPSAATNALTWTIHPRTFVVASVASEALRDALAAASAFTAAHAGHALVTFSPDVFPGAVSPQTVDLSALCAPDTPDAALRLAGDRVVVDALDGDGRPGAVVWSVDTCPTSVLHVVGADNVVRGVVLHGSQDAVADPATCGEAGSDDKQHDTIAFVGPTARGNTIDDAVVIGPTCGDAIGVQDGATANAVVATRIAGAQDRGVKANDGAVTIARSCLHDNAKGGIQSTLGGDVVATENVVQRNVGGTGGNGITVIDQCRADNPGCSHAGRSRLATTGNVVRFCTGPGLVVHDNAEAVFLHDYVADNDHKGSAVETTATVPVDAQGAQRVPVATFRGTALVCNRRDSERPGVGAETRSDAGYDAPVADYGVPGDPGRNAFTSNRRNNDTGANFLLTNVSGPIAAVGNQWGNCDVASCTVEPVRATDIKPLGADVQLVDEQGGLAGPRAGVPIVERTTPARPATGEVVRVYGDRFDAIGGNPLRHECGAVALRACDAESPCPTGPCVQGRCPCAITNAVVRERNDGSMPPNRVVIATADGTVLANVPPDAVTPTMLAFHMPFDCFAPLQLRVVKHGTSSAAVTLCDPQPQATTTTVAPPSTTSTTTTTSTTSTSTSTTTSTLPPTVCGLAVPDSGRIAQCSRRKLRRRAEAIALSIDDAIRAGRMPKCRSARRLAKLMRRCG